MFSLVVFSLCLALLDERVKGEGSGHRKHVFQSALFIGESALRSATVWEFGTCKEEKITLM